MIAYRKNHIFIVWTNLRLESLDDTDDADDSMFADFVGARRGC